MGIVVALDGPAGAGKSTIARHVARSLGYTLLDTGAIYRTVALAAERAGVPWDSADGMSAFTESVVKQSRITLVSLEGAGMEVHLDGAPVGDAIRTPEIAMGASKVSAIPGVRTALLPLQRDFAHEGRGVVCEGRDIGTVVFPDARVKIFLTASPEERARRRFGELREKDPSMTFEKTLAAVIARDAQDAGRAVAPLKRADDAILVDSTGWDVQRSAAHVLELVREKARALGADDGREGRG